jgi:hypothetical protein
MPVDAGLLPLLPFASFEFVEVTFTEHTTATRVPHGLAPADPYAVRYIPIFKDRECVISDARLEAGAHTEPWTRNYIVLQSNVAPVTVELLVFVPRRKVS